ncbi:MAG: sulfatase-like hydrolase/transferase [Myxococcota bacterium]
MAYVRCPTHAKPACGIVARLVVTISLTFALPGGIGCSRTTEQERVDEHLRAADQHLAAGRFEAAKIEYEKAIRLDSTDPAAQVKMAIFDASRGNFSAAEKRFKAVLQRDPENRDALAGWGRLMAATSRLIDAESILRRAVEADPPSIPAAVDLARVLATLDRDEEALTAFDRAAALTEEPGTPFFLAWAEVLERQERFAEARDRLEAAVESTPRNPVALSRLGTALVFQGDPERGIALLEQATSLRPADPMMLFSLGRAYLDVGRDAEALNLVQRSLATTDPSSSDFAIRAEVARRAEARIPRAAAGPDMPNILMVVTDTLRYDHVGAYGYHLPTTPRLDALARHGVVFETAISQAPWTAPAVASLLTGLYPSVHGLDGGIGWGEGVSSADGTLPFAIQKTLAPAQETLAELLRRSGYRTAGFVSNLYVNSIFGFAQGFDHFDDEHHDYEEVSQVKRRAEETNARVFEWLRTEIEEPFFLFVHFNDPHWPYDPPPPYGQGFVTGYRGSLTPAATRDLVIGGRSKAPKVSAEDLDYIVGLYDGEIQYVDAQLGRLLDTLSQLPLAREVVTVVTADHGEEFLDHGAFNHGYSLYDEQVRVPLVLSAPSILRPTRIARQVQLIDVTPTILELAGIEIPTDTLQGSSLLSLAKGEERSAADAFSEATYVGEQSAIRSAGALKLIHSAGGREWMLFDVGADSSERHDLVANRHRDLNELALRLDQWRRGNDAFRELIIPAGSGLDWVVVDQSSRDRLRALGYLD